jgi:hypothetical protein
MRTVYALLYAAYCIHVVCNGNGLHNARKTRRSLILNLFTSPYARHHDKSYIYNQGPDFDDMSFFLVSYAMLLYNLGYELLVTEM